MTLEVDAAVMLVDMANSGDLARLSSLSLNFQNYSTGAEPPIDDVIRDLISVLHPLTELELFGYVYDKAFYAALQTHGASLRRFTFATKSDIRPSEAPLILTDRHITDLCLSCPYLTRLKFRVTRTHGDHDEVRIYKALGQLSRLERLTLDLDVGTHSASDPSPQNLYRRLVSERASRSILMNAATDAALVTSIFRAISAPRLVRLKLAPFYHMPSSDISSVVHWISNSWICCRGPGMTDALMLQKLGTSSVLQVDRYMDRLKVLNYEHAWAKAWKELWPWSIEPGVDWRNTWSSIPLAVLEDEA
jgi:hypothetical protein